MAITAPLPNQTEPLVDLATGRINSPTWWRYFQSFRSQTVSTTEDLAAGGLDDPQTMIAMSRTEELRREIDALPLPDVGAMARETDLQAALDRMSVEVLTLTSALSAATAKITELEGRLEALETTEPLWQHAL